MINILSPLPEKEFENGNIVFKITTCGDEKMLDDGIVHSKEEYESKLYNRPYDSLLYCVPIHLRIAYLFGTLNKQFRIKRDRTFTFWWRRQGYDYRKWQKWFVLEPYEDEIYKMAPAG